MPEGVYTMLSIAPGSGFIEYKRVRKESRDSIFPIMNTSNDIKISEGVWIGAIYVL
jgi:hypothetical protein